MRWTGRGTRASSATTRTAAAWDSTRRRLLEHGSRSGDGTALPLSEDGVFGERAVLPGPLPSDVGMAVSSDGAFLLASRTVYDAESLNAVWHFPSVGAAVARWHGGRLVALFEELGSLNYETRYYEYAPDGTLLGTLPRGAPGRPLAVLPFGERVVLVRQLAGRPVFSIAAPGSGDVDEDGVGDAKDVFPLDRSETSDRDGDGVGDNGDPFPDDGGESADRDGDGVGDNGDFLPDLAAVAFARLTGRQTLGFAGVGRLRGDFSGQLHLFADGGFALCTGREACLGGGVRPAGSLRTPRLDLAVAPEVLAPLADALEYSAERVLGGLGLELTFVHTPRNGTVREVAGGALRIRLRIHHRARIQRVGLVRGNYRVDASGPVQLAPAKGP